MTRSAFECICRNIGHPVADHKAFRAINYLERRGEIFGGTYGVKNAVERARVLRWQLREMRRLEETQKGIGAASGA